MPDVGFRLDPFTQVVAVEPYRPTVSVIWDRAVQEAVTIERSGPTIASRAYALTHTAIYDAWAQFDPHAVATSIGDSLQQPAEYRTDAIKTVAMSHAAHDVLVALFPDHAESFARTLVEALGYDPALLPSGGDAASLVGADIGREVAAALLETRAADGANSTDEYADPNGYAPVNANALAVEDIARWTPEAVPIDPERAEDAQTYLTPHWGEVEPFALPSGDALRPPPPEPFFLPGVEAELDIESRTIRLADGSELAVSRDLVGTIINPGFIAQAERVVEASARLTDKQKLIAEFWEDGPGTAFPPGTWMTFGQYISARDGHDLDADAKLFMVLANAGFDAGIATWEAKLFYDYARPVRAVRMLGQLGLIGEEGVDSQTGETGFVIDAWGGTGEGTQTVLASRFLTYQPPGGDASPPFPEYTSGHSSFSAAGAFILEAFSGGPEFGAEITFPPGHSRFEPEATPVEPTTLGWDTFVDAADEAGLSRIFGGIHFDDGDLFGRDLGRQAAELAWREAQRLVTGAADKLDDLAPLLVVGGDGGPLDEALVKPILPGLLTLTEAATVTVDVIASDSDLAQQLFAYTVAEDGTFADVVAVLDMDGMGEGSTGAVALPLGVMPAGTELGLLLATRPLPLDGHDSTTTYALLDAAGDPASIHQGAPPTLVATGATGGELPLDAALHFALDYDLAPGNRLNTSGDIQAIAGADDDRLMIAFEDGERHRGAGDDFADLILAVDIVPVVANEPQAMVQPPAPSLGSDHDPQAALDLIALLDESERIEGLDDPQAGTVAAGQADAADGQGAIPPPVVFASDAGAVDLDLDQLLVETVG